MIDTSKQAGSLLPDSLTQRTKIAGLLTPKHRSLTRLITPLDAVLHMSGGQFVKGSTDFKEIGQHFGKY